MNITQIEKLIEVTPRDKRKLIIDYLKNKTPNTLEPSIIQSDCKLTSSQAYLLKQICDETADGNLLSLTINAFSQINDQKNNEISRLVMS